MKNRIIALAVVMVLLLLSVLFSQAPDTLWTRKTMFSRNSHEYIDNANVPHEMELLPSEIRIIERTKYSFVNDDRSKELDTLFYDDGYPYTGYHGPIAFYWAVRFTPPRPCTVKAGIFQIWAIPSHITAVCTIFIWDDRDIFPGNVVDGPIVVEASHVPSWNKGIFPAGYTDADDFWIGYWLPFAHDSFWAATDSSTDYLTRKAYGVRTGGGWTWQYGGFAGDLMIRAIVSYGGSEISVTPDTLKFKLILPNYKDVSSLSSPAFWRAEDTVKIDDGILSGWGTNGELQWKEAVKLTPSGPCTLVAVLYYPHDPNSQNPALHWSVWDDDGPWGFPSTQVANGTILNPIYGDWYRVNLPSPTYFIGGSFYAGWEDLTLPGIYMGCDSNLDGYNYWYNGSEWLLDDCFPGDFMVRGIVHYWQPSDTDTVKVMTINNVGIDSLNIDSIIPADSWIVSIVPNTLAIAPKGADYVTVTVSRNSLPNGIHHSNLFIYSDASFENPYIEPVKFELGIGGAIEEEEDIVVSNNYCIDIFPNPAKRFCMITYSIPEKADIEIKIYDISGRMVKKLIKSKMAPGRHSVIWDGKDDNGIDVSQGIYFCYLITERYKISTKLSIIR